MPAAGRHVTGLAILTLCAALAGCATGGAITQGRNAEQRQDYDQAVVGVHPGAGARPRQQGRARVAGPGEASGVAGSLHPGPARRRHGEARRGPRRVPGRLRDEPLERRDRRRPGGHAQSAAREGGGGPGRQDGAPGPDRAGANLAARPDSTCPRPRPCRRPSSSGAPAAATSSPPCRGLPASTWCSTRPSGTRRFPSISATQPSNRP